jgi:hypothetical protein
MGGPTGRGDDHLDAGVGRATGEGDGVVGRPVGRKHPDLDRDREGPESLDGVVHDRRVGRTSHDDGYGHEGILPDSRPAFTLVPAVPYAGSQAARYGGPLVAGRGPRRALAGFDRHEREAQCASA